MISNKRGQGLSVNAIILMILGVFVLAMLIIGFTIGYGTLKDKLIPSNNVKTIVDACSVACTTHSVYDFCTVPRELKDAEGNEVTNNCNNFATDVKYNKYGIKECSGLCTISTEKKVCGDVKETISDGTEKTAAVKDSCGDDEKDITKSVKELGEGQVCCIATK